MRFWGSTKGYKIFLILNRRSYFVPQGDYPLCGGVNDSGTVSKT